MLKEVLASNTAKLVAACVCPAVGATAVALKVPQVRAAVHKATAPKPERHARAKPRIREPEKPDIDQRELAMREAALCPQPVMLQNAPLDTRSSAALTFTPAPVIETRTVERIVYIPSGTCGGGGTIIRGGVGAVPEPATWAQMIAGFALMGAAIRAGRRRRIASPA